MDRPAGGPARPAGGVDRRRSHPCGSDPGRAAPRSPRPAARPARTHRDPWPALRAVRQGCGCRPSRVPQDPRRIPARPRRHREAVGADLPAVRSPGRPPPPPAPAPRHGAGSPPPSPTDRRRTGGPVATPPAPPGRSSESRRQPAGRRPSDSSAHRSCGHPTGGGAGPGGSAGSDGGGDGGGPRARRATRPTARGSSAARRPPTRAGSGRPGAEGPAGRAPGCRSAPARQSAPGAAGRAGRSSAYASATGQGPDGEGRSGCGLRLPGRAYGPRSAVGDRRRRLLRRTILPSPRPGGGRSQSRSSRPARRTRVRAARRKYGNPGSRFE